MALLSYLGAEQEQLDILLQGVDTWNAWRITTPDVNPDFSGAELSEENLSWANLSGINLSEANLYYTNLQQANLSGANLFRAHLDEAIMPDYMIPFVPIIHEKEEPFAMFRDLKTKYGDWVLDVLEYDSAASLIQVLDKAVVRPALIMADQLIVQKAEAIRKRHVKEYQ